MSKLQDEILKQLDKESPLPLGELWARLFNLSERPQWSYLNMTQALFALEVRNIVQLYIKDGYTYASASDREHPEGSPP